MKLEELLGKDLAGYTFVQWYEVQRSTSEWGNYVPGNEYYTDKALAEVMAKGAGFYGANGQVEQIYVLVKHEEKQGLALSGLQPGAVIKLADEQERRLASARKALAKLDPEERQLLGLEDDAAEPQDQED